MPEILQSDDTSSEFPVGKEAYCAQCYFESDDEDIVILKKDCPHSNQ